MPSTIPDCSHRTIDGSAPTSVKSRTAASSPSVFGAVVLNQSEYSRPDIWIAPSIVPSTPSAVSARPRAPRTRVRAAGAARASSSQP